MKISSSELRVYRTLPLCGLVMFGATYFIRWKLVTNSVILKLLLNTMPNFCMAIILPFITLLIIYRIKPDFLIKNKAKIFYTSMPVITVLFIAFEIFKMCRGKYKADIYDMVMSITGMVVCMLIFESINKPVIITGYDDISSKNKHD